MNGHTKLVCEIPRSFERSSPSNFRTQGSFIHINSEKIFERDLLPSDSVAKSATQNLEKKNLSTKKQRRIGESEQSSYCISVMKI